jgi:hypothetical protein
MTLMVIAVGHISNTMVRDGLHKPHCKCAYRPKAADVPRAAIKVRRYSIYLLLGGFLLLGAELPEAGRRCCASFDQLLKPYPEAQPQSAQRQQT